MAFVTGHPEYDALTLAGEYCRDNDAGLNPSVPLNYFPDDNPELPPQLHGEAMVTCCFPTG